MSEGVCPSDALSGDSGPNANDPGAMLFKQTSNLNSAIGRLRRAGFQSHILSLVISREMIQSRLLLLDEWPVW